MRLHRRAFLQALTTGLAALGWVRPAKAQQVPRQATQRIHPSWGERMNWKSLDGARKLLAIWTEREPEPNIWPPYPVIANEHGDMARLYLNSPVPEGWTVIGTNCAHTASLERLGRWSGVSVVHLLPHE